MTHPEDVDMEDDVGEEKPVDAMEQKRINEEYKIWKKNAVFLYDNVYARALKWPTLTAQWLPQVQEVKDGLQQHRLLIGTNAPGSEDNFLQLVHIKIPKDVDPDAADFNETTGEIGGYGASKEAFDFEIYQSIKHPGEVNKARYMIQNPELIATWSVNDGVLIWDRRNHTLKAEEDKNTKPLFTCVGHSKEGFGLSWSPHHEGHLLTASEDETVKTWRVDARGSGSDKLNPLYTWTHHSAVVNDVQHHPKHQAWAVTASDDLSWAMIDTRESAEKRVALQREKAHDDAINAIACHPEFHHVIATGSADKTVAIWDLRSINRKIGSIDAHQDAVIQLQWHPEDPAILTSGSYDRRINIYDMSRTGEEQTEEEAEEGPPELLWMHGGFTNRVTEFDWNKNQPWWMLAAAEDNQLQIFRPAKALVNEPPRKAVINGEIEES